jgi:ketosteroid isomerase-like protein
MGRISTATSSTDTNREQIITDYIRAYNRFDIDGMLVNLHPEIEFVNISNGETNLTLQGIEKFREQAEIAMAVFTERHQEVISMRSQLDTAEVEIDYRGILAIDLPMGLKKGDTLELKGKSIFKFSDGKIIQLTDIS